MQKQTIILDFDGTIADSFALIVRIGHQLTHRTDLVTPEEIVRLRKLRLLEVARELRIPKWRLPLLIIRGRKAMARHMDEVLLFGGMREAITDLHKAGYQMFIVSTNSTANVQKFLEMHTLTDCFEAVYGNIGLLGKAKALRRVIRANKLDPDSCFYVGDEPRDIEGAHAAGIDCISVSWGFNTAKLLHEHAPYAVVETPEELVQTIRNHEA
jgi:HAD superfamily hydrolase (TIGR01549 family)